MTTKIYTREAKLDLLVRHLWDAHQKLMAEMAMVEQKCRLAGISPAGFWEAYYWHDREEKGKRVT